MSCGGNLVVLREQARQAAEERRRREEAIARYRSAEQFARRAIASGQSPGEVYTALAEAGWPPEQIAQLMGLSEAELVLENPGGGYVVISTPQDAKLARKELQLAKKELRLRKTQLTAEAREVRREYSDSKPGPMQRQASYGRGNLAGVFRAMDDAGRAGHRAQVDAHRRERDSALAAIDQEKAGIDRSILACDRLIHEVDTWCEAHSAQPARTTQHRPSSHKAGDDDIDIEFH